MSAIDIATGPGQSLTEARVELGRARRKWTRVVAKWLLQRNHEGRADWYDELGNYISRGDPITLAFAKMADLIDPKRRVGGFMSMPHHQTVVMDDMLMRLEQRSDEGNEDAAAIFYRWLPSREAMMLAAIYSKGLAEAPVRKLADMTNKMAEWSDELKAAWQQPLLIAVLVYGGFYYAATSILPDLFDQLPEATLKGQAGSFAALSIFMADRGLQLAGVLAAISGLIYWSFKNCTGRVRTYLDKLPPWTFYRRNEGTSFLIAFGMLLSAGKGMMQALEELRDQGTPYIADRIAALLRGDEKDLAGMFSSTGQNWPSAEIIRSLGHLTASDNLGEEITALGFKWMERDARATTRRAKQFKNYSTIAMGMFTIWTIQVGNDLSQSVVNNNF